MSAKSPRRCAVHGKLHLCPPWVAYDTVCHVWPGRKARLYPPLWAATDNWFTSALVPGMSTLSSATSAALASSRCRLNHRLLHSRAPCFCCSPAAEAPSRKVHPPPCQLSRHATWQAPRTTRLLQAAASSFQPPPRRSSAKRRVQHARYGPGRPGRGFSTSSTWTPQRVCLKGRVRHASMVRWYGARVYVPVYVTFAAQSGNVAVCIGSSRARGPCCSPGPRTHCTTLWPLPGSANAKGDQATLVYVPV